jgi:hypothetical protein
MGNSIEGKLLRSCIEPCDPAPIVEGRRLTLQEETAEWKSTVQMRPRWRAPVEKDEEPFDKLRVSGRRSFKSGRKTAHAEPVEAPGGFFNGLLSRAGGRKDKAESGQHLFVYVIATGIQG